MGNCRIHRRGRKSVTEVFLFVVMAVCFFLQCLPPSAMAADAKQAGGKELEALSGRWIRPDGGYVLELKEIKKDGRLKAAYFNPKPINISRSEIHRNGGKITVFIELRDVNYPGSKYNLRYDPSTDRLVGTYFQAVEKKTYNIEFLRAE